MNLIRHGVYAVPPSPRCGEGEDRFAIGQRLSSAYSAHPVGVLLPSPHRGDKVSPYGADEVPIDKNDRAVFDVGETILRINRRLNADLASHLGSKNHKRPLYKEPFVTLFLFNSSA